MAVDEYVWRVGSLKKGDGKTQPHKLSATRLISDEERTRLDDASALLSEVTDNSPFNRLAYKYLHFNRYVASIAENYRNRAGNPEELKAIPERLDDLLSAFRAFDDRTCNNLSKRYGKESDQLKLFRGALSFEFDNVFAYKFSCQLRNYSQHAGSPISSYPMTKCHICSGSRLDLAKELHPLVISRMLRNSSLME